LTHDRDPRSNAEISAYWKSRQQRPDSRIINRPNLPVKEKAGATTSYPNNTILAGSVMLPPFLEFTLSLR
jgi:hypothetical protein